LTKSANAHERRKDFLSQIEINAPLEAIKRGREPSLAFVRFSELCVYRASMDFFIVRFQIAT